MSLNDALLQSAFESVQADLRRTCPLTIEVILGERSIDGSAVISVGLDGCSTGLTVSRPMPQADALVLVANQLQDFIVERLPNRGLPALWPECPRHPGTHPLSPSRVGNDAWWLCPVEQFPISKIGLLGAGHDL